MTAKVSKPKEPISSNGSAPDVLDNILKAAGVQAKHDKRHDVRDVEHAIFSPTFLKAKTLMNAKQIHAFTIAYAYAEHYDDSDTVKILDTSLEFLIAKGGQGHRSLVKVLSALFSRQQDEELEKVGLKQRLLGR